MLEYARMCRTSTLIMVPINFWRISDLVLKKEHFSSSKIDKARAFQTKSFSSKIDKVRAFQRNSFRENLSNTKHKSLKRLELLYSKIDKVRAFQRKSLNSFKENISILSKEISQFFQRKLSNIKHKFLKRFWSYNDGCEYQV